MGGHQQQHSRAGSSSKTAAPVGLQQRQQQPLSILSHVESLLKTNTNSHTCQPSLRQGPHLKSPPLSFSLIFPFLLSHHHHHHQSTNEPLILVLHTTEFNRDKHMPNFLMPTFYIHSGETYSF